MTVASNKHNYGLNQDLLTTDSAEKVIEQSSAGDHPVDGTAGGFFLTSSGDVDHRTAVVPSEVASETDVMKMNNVVRQCERDGEFGGSQKDSMEMARRESLAKIRDRLDRDRRSRSVPSKGKSSKAASKVQSFNT